MRGAWIEIMTFSRSSMRLTVAPPCGARGLKFKENEALRSRVESRPHAGRVD